MRLYRLWSSNNPTLFFPSLRTARAAIGAQRAQGSRDLAIDRFTIKGKQGVCDIANAYFGGAPYEDNSEDIWKENP